MHGQNIHNSYRSGEFQKYFLAQLGEESRLEFILGKHNSHAGKDVTLQGFHFHFNTYYTNNKS